MKKLLLLIRVMRKCGHTEKKASASASAHTGNISDLLAPILGIAFAAAMFFAGRYLAQNQASMGAFDSIFSTIMLFGALTAFFLSIPQVINRLYMSSDLDVLITLPFTDVEIVTGKLASVCVLPMELCCALVIPCGIGFAVTAGGFGFLYWVGLILSAPMLALCMVSLASTVIILLMRVFRFIRNRNLISIISTLLLFGVMLAYILTDTGSDLDRVGQMFAAMSNALSGVTKLIPVISLCIRTMTGSGILPLLAALGITLGALLMMFIAAKLFYFSAALGMTDAAAGNGRMTDQKLLKATRASGVRAALRRREMRTILRTPSLITNGYLYSIIVPPVILVPTALKIINAVGDTLKDRNMDGFLDLAGLRMIIQLLSISWPVWCLIIFALMLFMSSMSVCMSVLSRGCISREGKNYAVLKAMPVSMTAVVMIKRDLAMMFNGISGFLMPFLLIAAGAVLKLIPAWTVAVAFVVGTACMVFLVDMCCLFGVRKPNLNWESEADACKNNIPGLILFFGCIAGLVALALALLDAGNADLTRVVAVAACVVPVVLAIVFDILLRKAAAQMTDRY